MGLLSGLAVIAAFIFLALTLGGWATISAGVMGVILLICAGLILLDLFFVGYVTPRRRTPNP